MSLINCPECKHQVSDRAKSCPHCGYQFSKIFMDEICNGLYDMVLFKINKVNDLSLACHICWYILEMNFEAVDNILKEKKERLLIKGIEYKNAKYLHDIFMIVGYDIRPVKTESTYVNPVNPKLNKIRMSSCLNKYD